MPHPLTGHAAPSMVRRHAALAVIVLALAVAAFHWPAFLRALGIAGGAAVALHVGLALAVFLALSASLHRHGKGASAGSTIHSPRIYDVGAWFYTSGRESRLRQRILDVAGVVEGARMLDVCSGTGTLALAAADRVGPSGSVNGVDASAEMVGHAREKAHGRNVRFEVAGAQTLPFADKSFDVVTCTLGMHHLPAQDRPSVLAEMHRVLAPGGRLVVVDFAPVRGLARLHPIALMHGVAGTTILEETRDAMTRVGFGEMEANAMGFAGLGYVRARRV